VGALALPWVLLVIHLFFFEGEDRLGGVLDWVTAPGRQAVAGVLLFAMTYTLGSAVSRTARDFFNDDDLRVQVGWQLFRVGVTEDRIIARIYCQAHDDNLLPAKTDNPAIAEKIATFRTQASADGCQRTLRWSERHKYEDKDDYLIGTARDLFGLQENALLLKGEDPTLRLRQLHDQIMVLRGAAFNGFMGFSLCIFAWGAKLRREKPHSWLRLALLPAPIPYFVVTLIASVHHFEPRAPSDPPYLEFTLLLLGVVGAWLLWRRPAPPEHARAHQSQEKQVQAAAPDAGKEAAKECPWKIEHWARLSVISAILTTATILGWWSTEVLYTEQVIYSYDSQISQSKATATAEK
jgi:hypothetical protein